MDDKNSRQGHKTKEVSEWRAAAEVSHSDDLVNRLQGPPPARWLSRRGLGHVLRLYTLTPGLPRMSHTRTYVTGFIRRRHANVTPVTCPSEIREPPVICHRSAGWSHARPTNHCTVTNSRCNGRADGTTLTTRCSGVKVGAGTTSVVAERAVQVQPI